MASGAGVDSLSVVDVVGRYYSGVVGDEAKWVKPAATLVMCIAAWLWWYRWSQRHSTGPKEWPLVGILPEASSNFLRIHDWITEYMYKGHTFRASVGFGFNFLMTVDPANVEHVMKTNFANYPKGPRIISINDDFFGQGIFNTDGDLWMHQRKVAAIEFATVRLRTFSTQIFADYASRLGNRLLDKCKSTSPFDLQELMSRMTLDTTVRIAFGVDLGSLAPSLPFVAVAKSYNTASTCSFGRFFRPLWKLEKLLQIGPERDLRQAVKTLDTFAYDVIQRRKLELPTDGNLALQVNEEKDDLLSRFVKMSKQGDTRFGDRALRDIMINYILAGKDSTSAVICWTVYAMALHPHIIVKVREELARMMQQQPNAPGKLQPDQQSEEEAVRAFSELLTFDNVGSLTYLHAVITETMRLYPPVPLNAKEAVADDILPSGHVVRRGDSVGFHPYGMGRMPYVWGPDAADFKPERWLRNGSFQQESPYKYIAFQGGPRLCLGKDSSYLQMKITVALITQFFDFKLIPGVHYHYKTMLSLLFEKGLPVTVHKRIF